MAKPAIELTGRVIGRLTVLRRNGKAATGNILWLCKCECGVHKTFYGSDLKSGKTKSCGCLNSELVIQRLTTHGGSKTRIYRIWYTMILRCEDPRLEAFDNYGARGISVCEEWHNFEIFRSWAISNGYSERRSIDRIDNDGNYEPSNCRWATAKDQMLNRRITKRNSDGKPWSVVAEEHGVPSRIFSSRICQKWSPEKASTTPVRRYRT